MGRVQWCDGPTTAIAIILFHNAPVRRLVAQKERGITPLLATFGLVDRQETFFMRIAMIGTGYVGLVSGACFSEFGVSVTCVDKDAGKIERLHRGEMPIYEPGLDQLVAGNVRAGRLGFSIDLRPAVAAADAVFIAV